ncbi:hypothetical protein RDI58_001253 [Solanum bulbocastanum]|uniref:Uncharacterized protein n=1 Tax=Solanum bulbocastanum TaxID=147425 RepID=A0AAN8U4S1_SOLBU
MEDLLSLSCGPTRYSMHSNGYIVNGYRFHVEDYDKKLRTQNFGVVVLGDNDKDSENLDYYGVLTDVIELQFVMDKRVVLFRCNLFDVCDEIKGVKKDEFKMKQMKTENEADSSMKSTIRYTFVAPDAIGKGQGRGLKLWLREETFQLRVLCLNLVILLMSASKKLKQERVEGKDLQTLLC